MRHTTFLRRPLAGVLLLGLWPALGLAEPVAFNIPAQPLGSALNQLAEQSGLQVIYNGELVHGLASPGVSGSQEPEVALQRLLQGSGLIWHPSGAGSVTLEKAPERSDALELGATSVTGRQLSATTEGSGSYLGSTTTRAKGSTLRETPQTVTVVTQQRIADQNLKTVAEVMDQVPGITVTNGFFGSSDRTYYARGFLISNTQIDGSAAASSLNSYDYNPNLLAFDHVEVIRGADGLFAGNGEPGGSINLTRKRATLVPQVLVEASAASWDRYGTVVDVSGLLGWDNRLRGRMVASHQDTHSYMDLVEDRTSFLYTTLEADLTDSTLLIAGVSHEKSKGVDWIMGLPRYANGDDLGLSRSTSPASDWTRNDSETTEIFARLEQRLNEDWLLSAALTRTKSDTDYWLGVAWGSVDPVTQMGPYRYMDRYIYEREMTFYDVSLSGNFELLGRQHKLVVGVDGQKVDPGLTGRYYVPGGANNAVDVFAPDHGAAAEPDWDAYASSMSERKEVQQGAYAKVQLALTERLALITGARLGTFDYQSQSVGSTKTHYRESGILTPYAGLVYDLTDDWSLYASVSDIYKSQANRLKGPLPGSPLQPIEGRNYEIGSKAEFHDGRLMATFALYRIERTGQAIQDPAYPTAVVGQGLNCCYLDDGEILSQGIDTEITGELLPGLQVAAGYTYNSNENKVSSVRYNTATPRHLFKFWSTYRLPGDWSAFDVGGGVNVQSRQSVEGTATYNPATRQFDGVSRPYAFSQSGYAVWNARAGYRVDEHWSLALNVNNVFDKKYYRTLGASTDGNWYGDPRSTALTLRGSF